MRRTFARFKMARAIQSSCFSLMRRTASAQVVSNARRGYSPCRKVLSPLGDRGVEVAEDVGVDSVGSRVRVIISRDEVDTPQSFVLCTRLVSGRARLCNHNSYNLHVLVLVEDV